MPQGTNRLERNGWNATTGNKTVGNATVGNELAGNELAGNELAGNELEAHRTEQNSDTFGALLGATVKSSNLDLMIAPYTLRTLGGGATVLQITIFITAISESRWGKVANTVSN
jgi:hypothetical protein